MLPKSCIMPSLDTFQTFPVPQENCRMMKSSSNAWVSHTPHTTHPTPHTPYHTAHTTHTIPHTPYHTPHTTHTIPHTPHHTHHTTHPIPHTPHHTHTYTHHHSTRGTGAAVCSKAASTVFKNRVGERGERDGEREVSDTHVIDMNTQ